MSENPTKDQVEGVFEYLKNDSNVRPYEMELLANAYRALESKLAQADTENASLMKRVEAQSQRIEWMGGDQMKREDSLRDLLARAVEALKQIKPLAGESADRFLFRVVQVAEKALAAVSSLRCPHGWIGECQTTATCKISSVPDLAGAAEERRLEQKVLSAAQAKASVTDILNADEWDKQIHSAVRALDAHRARPGG